MSHSAKKIILTTALLGSVCLAQADNMGNSDATQFAVQAGSIAGMTQSCGQDISIFTSRVNEALNKLATSPSDRMQAIATFQRVMQQAQTMETTNHTISCAQVVQDYNNLPILRADYQQTVIAQLHPGMPQMATAQPAPGSVSPAAPAPSSLQPLPQGSTVPGVPNTATTPPPAPAYNQGTLPGAQQQMMSQPPANPASPTAPAATLPAAPVDQQNPNNGQNGYGGQSVPANPNNPNGAGNN